MWRAPPFPVFATPPFDDDAPRTEGESANASSTAPQSGVAPGGGGGTLIVFDQVFFAHNTSKGCQECPARVEVLMGRAGLLRDTTNSVGRGRVSFEEHVEPARLADILRVHDWEYIGQLASRCAKGNSDNSPMGTLDPPGHPQDTSFSAQSYLVARTAAGAVCKAVDRVMRGEQRNAFVASRPPGHHAGPRGLVHTDDGRPSLSQGFCLINNVAVGAAYAKYNYPEAKRIAIVDFPPHNGDGTAACVRNLKPHLETRRVGAGLSVTNTVYKPWLDESDGENVFFASVHLVAENFYPQVASQGYNQAGSTSWPEFEAFTTGATNDPAEPTILNVPLEKTTTKAESSQMFRERILEKLIPKLNDFQPDLLFISAGRWRRRGGRGGWYRSSRVATTSSGRRRRCRATRVASPRRCCSQPPRPSPERSPRAWPPTWLPSLTPSPLASSALPSKLWVLVAQIPCRDLGSQRRCIARAL
ncbi:histone deacetylase domain-containing protein [Baffinella frigidus]|nr:histone deacetylase domain-containing protein [Cryptophyta sp. CCMP2293]